jgi:hypothetical protein
LACQENVNRLCNKKRKINWIKNNLLWLLNYLKNILCVYAQREKNVFKYGSIGALKDYEFYNLFIYILHIQLSSTIIVSLVRKIRGGAPL